MAERPDDAASTLQRALEINPTGAAYTNFANLRFLQGRYAEAADAFEKRSA
jgi:tetratricopeptide (TPR) repeat protein